MSGNRMSSLPIVQYCSAAGVLGNKHGAGRAAAMSSAFHAVAAEQDEADTLLGMLTDAERAEIDRWYMPTDVTLADGTVLRYVESVREFETMLDVEGDYTDDPEGITSIGHPDMRWIAQHEIDGQPCKVCYIGDLKKTDYSSPDGVESLQLLAYGFAEASRNDCDAFCVGIWNLTDGGWDWGELIELGFESIPLLNRILRAAQNTDGKYTTGNHCRNCWDRLHCQEYLVPVQDPEAALYPLSQPGAITEQNALQMLGLVQRAKKLLPACEDQLKAYARSIGGIPDGDGKVWKEKVGKGGKMVMDKSRFIKHMEDEHEELTRDFYYETKGGSPMGFAWCKVPKAKKKDAA